jgi:hypothetical protein
VFLSLYKVDSFYDWAGKQFDEIQSKYSPFTCDLCIGEVVTNIVEARSLGDSVWHDALIDLYKRLQDYTIIRARGRGSRCEQSIWEIIDLQWKDKVWLTNAVHDRACHIFTTDRKVWENQSQLTKASQQIGGQAVKVHAPYRRT